MSQASDAEKYRSFDPLMGSDFVETLDMYYANGKLHIRFENIIPDSRVAREVRRRKS